MDNIFTARNYRKNLFFYWSVYVTTFSLIQGLPSGDIFTVFRNELISLAPKIVFAVIVVDMLDELLVRKKITGFVLRYLFLLVAFAFTLRLIDNYIILKYYLTWWHKEALLSAPPFLYDAIKLQFLSIIPFIIKIFNHKAEDEEPLPTAEHKSTPVNDQNSEQPFLLVRSGRRNHKIRLNEIVYVESQGNYLLIFTENDELKTYMPISEAEKRLPGHQFIRVHRSFIIASKKIDSFDGTRVEIRGRKVPIGRSYQLKVRNGLQFS